VNVNFESEQAVITFDPEELRLKEVMENMNRELKPNPGMP
jgi:hypothetical protein